MPGPVTIMTADDECVIVGTVVFDYYSMRLGEIMTEPDDLGWFYVRHLETNNRKLLNSERICSLSHALKMGWKEKEDA